MKKNTHTAKTPEALALENSMLRRKIEAFRISNFQLKIRAFKAELKNLKLMAEIERMKKEQDPESYAPVDLSPYKK